MSCLIPSVLKIQNKITVSSALSLELQMLQEQSLLELLQSQVQCHLCSQALEHQNLEELPLVLRYQKVNVSIHAI